MEYIIFLIIFVASYTGVYLFKEWSLRRDIIDVPNERSSHTIPTPRGGGLVIVLLCLLFFTAYALAAPAFVLWGYIIGASIIALISWFDDLSEVSFVWRFLAHAVAALLVVYSAGFFDVVLLPLFGTVILGSFAGIILTFIWIVWFTNAYNFMDGIDGIAGMQAVIAGLGWLLIGKFLGFADISFYGGVIAFASAGFLVHNWQPAKIFMGDVGSAFLGFSFAVLPLLSMSRNKIEVKALPFIAVSLVSVFVLDTVYTFFRRLRKREKVWQAHRSHVYQLMVINGRTHQFVTLIYSFFAIISAIMLLIWLRSVQII